MPLPSPRASWTPDEDCAARRDNPPRPISGAPSRQPNPAERTPWLLGFLCLLIPVLPTYVVLPGPLKSNGSPARMIAVMFFGLVVLGFVMVRRTAHARECAQVR